MTWNTRAQDDCAFQARANLHDVDLAGTPAWDDDRTGAYMDGAFDCEGIPTLPGDPAIGAYVSATNWLAHLELLANPHLRPHRQQWPSPTTGRRSTMAGVSYGI